MKETNIFEMKMTEIVKEYYKFHYYGMASIKVTPKLIDDSLNVVVKIKSKINGKKIVQTEILDKDKIVKVIYDYMEFREWNIQKIDTNTLDVIYDGDHVIENKRKLRTRRAI